MPILHSYFPLVQEKRILLGQLLTPITLICYFVYQITTKSVTQVYCLIDNETQKSKIRSHWAKLRCQHGYVPSSGLGRISIFLPFSIFKDRSLASSNLSLILTSFSASLLFIRAIVITLNLLEQSRVIFLFQGQLIIILNSM